MTRRERIEAIRERANWYRTAANTQLRRYQDQKSAEWYRAKAVELETQAAALDRTT